LESAALKEWQKLDKMIQQKFAENQKNLVNTRGFIVRIMWDEGLLQN